MVCQYNHGLEYRWMGILGFEGYLRERGVFFFDVDDFVRLRAVGLANAAAAAAASCACCFSCISCSVLAYSSFTL
eukprot:COSAG02_NODE_315_length_24910_cov_17.139978_15_plen_75_part_00